MTRTAARGGRAGTAAVALFAVVPDVVVQELFKKGKNRRYVSLGPTGAATSIHATQLRNSAIFVAPARRRRIKKNQKKIMHSPFLGRAEGYDGRDHPCPCPSS